MSDQEYERGDKISDEHLSDVTDGFIGPHGIGPGYTSEIQCYNNLGAFWGVGYGTYGYGQTTPVLVAPTEDSVVTADTWNNILSVADIMSEHQGTDITSIRPPNVTVGGVIKTHEILENPSRSASGDYHELIDILELNRLNISDAYKASEEVETSTRSGSWSTLLEHKFSVAFASEDEARYFFNTGGKIKFDLSLTASSPSPQTEYWMNLLNTQLGFIVFDYEKTYNSTDNSVFSNVGFYQLTDTFESLTGRTGGLSGGIYGGGVAGVYSATSSYLEIRAKVSTLTNVRGAPGSTIDFEVILADGYTGTTDSVDGTLTSSVLTEYSNHGSMTIPLPTVTVTQSLSGS